MNQTIEDILMVYQVRCDRLSNQRASGSINQDKYASELLKLDAEAKQAIEALITERERLAIERYIQPYLDYCKEHNGMPVCKNCGLSHPTKEDKDKPVTVRFGYVPNSKDEKG